MTHLSDYSFVQRAVANGWFYLWFLGYVFMWDRFDALNPRRIFRFELRSIVTLALLVAMPLNLVYDIGSANIKYQEGFMDVSNGAGVIMAKPSQFWARGHEDQAKLLDYCLSVGTALLTSVFFLLQSFWSFISKSVTKSTFMTSFEFRLNIVISIIVIVFFPTCQYLFRNDHARREAAPQMAFSAFLLLVSLLGVRTHFRFNSLLKAAMNTVTEATKSVVVKLEYFKDLNLILSGALFGASVSLGIASADGLRPEPTIARNKFASDFLITNVNFFSFIIWVTLVLIFYPRRTAVGNVFGSSSGGTMSRTAPTAVGTGRYNNSKSGYESGGERPASHVPYKAPSSTKKADFDLERNNSNYHDTYPLTRSQQDNADLVQMETFKKMYDTNASDSMQSPPQSPVSPRHLRSGAPASSPSFGSPAVRQIQQPSKSYVDHQNFVLEEAPGSSHQRAKMAAMQQQQQQQHHYVDYEQGAPSTPIRSRKEPRNPMY
ncbi:hypothetical protein CPB97_000142 [Podila verticillata]|nr:hypothetical protein CPB97_000142 [Podila verticillata]